jgi:gliding motility-associated-like protein
MKVRLLLIFMLLFASAGMVTATHIAGAELTYSCSGNNLYTVRLTLFRDCLNGAAPFDDPITLFVFNQGSNTLYRTITDINVPSNTPAVLPGNWNACVATPYNLCLERATYVTTVQLPSSAQGYYFGWSRCCRNNTISNLSSPECEGITLVAAVPPSTAATCNSMPVFNQSPSIFLCANEPYYFDYSATDADGDSLVYSISNPFTGLNLAGLGTANNSGVCGLGVPPPVVDVTNLMGGAPYANVVYAAGHSFTNPFGPGGSISINPQTGYLQATPPNLGVYVVAVSVKEYRNGILLSENKRDFQFQVITCNPQDPPPVLVSDLSALNTNNDTILAEAGRPFCFTFQVTDPVVPSNIQVNPISVIFGGNGGFPPPYATISINSSTPPVNGQICWTPGCQYVGTTIPVVLAARDSMDCPNYNLVFDTIWIRVVPSPSVPPVVYHDLGSLNHVGDTLILDVRENFCFDFFVVDTLGSANLQAQNTLQDWNGNLLGQVHGVNTQIIGDTLFGQVCWQTYCNFQQTYMFVTRGYDAYQCAPGNTNYDTVWLRINPPPNPTPVLSTNVGSNPVINDTIQALVFQNFCFPFEVLDTSGTGSISFAYELRDLNDNLAPGWPVSYNASGTNDSIAGNMCWTPNCENVDQTYYFAIRAIQVNDCSIEGYDYDTIYVHVNEPIKPKPLLTHDLGQGPSNNSTIAVADAANFCYDFTLRDTVLPTQVRVHRLEVFAANGTLYTAAPQPTITYSTNLDSLVEGEVCWTVPCALSGQTFTLVMTGRDTFDCRTTSWVLDTVTIQHTENLPGSQAFCNVSVDYNDSLRQGNDAAIILDWTANTAPDLFGYRLYRRDPGSNSLNFLDSVLVNQGTRYTDMRNVDADQGSYYYEIEAFDRCLLPGSREPGHATVYLQGEQGDYVSDLSWTHYIGWSFGIRDHDIFRNYPELQGNPTALIATEGPLAMTHRDGTIVEPRNCYRIRTNSVEGDCGEISWSNDVCIDFPATLFVPNAFTPNGDGLNDYFTSFGEFEDEFELQIYDRWGKMIFQSFTQNPGWNGEINGKPVPEGVYVYRLRVRGFDGVELSRNGSITLYR